LVDDRAEFLAGLGGDRDVGRRAGFAVHRSYRDLIDSIHAGERGGNDERAFGLREQHLDAAARDHAEIVVAVSIQVCGGDGGRDAGQGGFEFAAPGGVELCISH